MVVEGAKREAIAGKRRKYEKYLIHRQNVQRTRIEMINYTFIPVRSSRYIMSSTIHKPKKIKRLYNG